MSENKKFRFNIIDAIVVLVILAATLFVGYNMFAPGSSAEKKEDEKKPKLETYVMSYFFEEVPEFAAEMVDKGTVVTDEAYGHKLGKLISVEVDDSVSYVGTDKGEIAATSREGYKSVALSVEVKAKAFSHGIEIEGTKYVVGHTMTIYAGKAKLYGRISGIEKK